MLSDSLKFFLCGHFLLCNKQGIYRVLVATSPGQKLPLKKKNVCCWISYFLCMLISFTLVWVCFQICLWGVILSKETYVNLYAIICYSLESNIHLFQLQMLMNASEVTCLDLGARYSHNKHLLNIYYVPGIVLAALCEWPHLFLPRSLWGRCY